MRLCQGHRPVLLPQLRPDHRSRRCCLHQLRRSAGRSRQRQEQADRRLLAIFLGAYGVHNFYLGFTGKAVAQLLITLLSCFTLSIVSGIWSLIEGIMLLTGKYEVDGKGNPLKD